jgi:SSS family solute:Na+ symporter
MLFLLITIYVLLGGVTDANQALTNLVNVVPANSTAAARQLDLQDGPLCPHWEVRSWWTLVSSLILGVGIGVLSQPQLVVRFMTVNLTRN